MTVSEVIAILKSKSDSKVKNLAWRNGAYSVYRAYPVSKGCVSPFAPIWIQEMVSRHM